MMLALIGVVLEYELWEGSSREFQRMLIRNGWYGTFIDSPAIFLTPLIGWAIRFILTGHKSPLPWVANKETDND